MSWVVCLVSEGVASHRARLKDVAASASDSLDVDLWSIEEL